MCSWIRRRCAPIRTRQARKKKRRRPGSGPLSRGLLHQNPRRHARRKLSPICQPSLVPSAASAVALHLTPGQAHDGRQFETLYESLDPENVLEFAALDKGYAADRIRARLARAGIEPVIPPISSRCQKLPSNKELYRGRNRVERFFNKLQQFRRLATRDDKLAKTFCAALHLGAAFLILRNS